MGTRVARQLGMQTSSSWLQALAITSIVVAAACAVVIALDLLRHRQHMGIMNLVWPITALWAGPVGLWGYLRYGRLGSEEAFSRAEALGIEAPTRGLPMRVQVGKGATHCGSGCTLGDLFAELLVLGAPLTIFGHRIFGTWIYDFILAFAFGIAFQYFTIKPMRHLSIGQGLWQALKADAFSLTAWQVGMYGWMAIVTFALFHRELPKSSPVFWFMMQIAMAIGFFTSFPVNWWLLRKGVKEAM